MLYNEEKCDTIREQLKHDAMDSEFMKILSELSREEKLELLRMWKERREQKCFHC